MGEGLSSRNECNLLPCYKFRLSEVYRVMADIYDDARWDDEAKLARQKSEWFRKACDEPLAPIALEYV